MSSVPTITEFDPYKVPYQIDVITDVKKRFNYSNGLQEILLSGSVGSAKSLLLSHLIITECLEFPNNHIGIGRQAMPHLKDTLFQMILDHLGNDVEYTYDKTRAIINFPNGSRITSVSWADKNFKKVRSYAFSCFAFEELTENKTDDAYKEIIMRCGRLNHIKRNWICCATNPDSPSHWAYKYFIEGSKRFENRHCYFSLTEQNPFLPKTYIQTLRQTLSKREADRMLRGQWVEVDSERVYDSYQSERNYKRDTKYKINPYYPIDLMHDFNVAINKPMSACLGQNIDGVYHVFASFHIAGFRTEQIMEEIAETGVFENRNSFRVMGDATGRRNDTRSFTDDYEIIEKFLSKYTRKNGSALNFEMCVPTVNPPIRKRTNLVNAFCHNDLGQVNLYVYDDWLDEGFRLTEYKVGSRLVENDELKNQHCICAIGYWLCYVENYLNVETEGIIFE